MAEINLYEADRSVTNDSTAFLREKWMGYTTRDPVDLVIKSGAYDHYVCWPRLYQKKDRKVSVTVWAPRGQKIREERIVRSQKVGDPVAVALAGAFFTSESDSDMIDGVDEAVVFQASLAFWPVARKYGLMPGRASKAQAARYAFAMLREFRAWRKK